MPRTSVVVDRGIAAVPRWPSFTGRRVAEVSGGLKVNYEKEIKTLREERANVYAAAEKAITEAHKAGEKLSAEQKQENDRRFADMSDLDHRIADLEQLK